jgi:hemerythrin-like domain-containing protein
MPIVIGAKPESNFTNPIGLLTDCHRRIERFLSVLLQVSTTARGGELTLEQRTALETALRYFHDAAPKHTADEEQSLFPRLRQMDRPEVKEMLAGGSA